MRECHLGTCAGGAEQFEECRTRAAFHEAGHGLLVCLISAAAGESAKPSLATLTLGIGPGATGCLALPEAAGGSPWHDALVLLGGPAADAVLNGEPPTEDGEDWSRSARLLRQLKVRVDTGEAFGAAEELVRHHRGVLETIAQALLRRGVLLGSELWRLFMASREEDWKP